MKIGNRMKFGDPEDITRPSEDGRSLRLPFAVVPLALAGTPREPEATTAHELIIRLSGNRATAWGLDEPRGRAVMLHAAVEHLFNVAREGEFRPSEELLIDAETFPGAIPERFDRPILVAGSILEMERDEKAMGPR
jgi:hypothetical protein